MTKNDAVQFINSTSDIDELRDVIRRCRDRIQGLGVLESVKLRVGDRVVTGEHGPQSHHRGEGLGVIEKRGRTRWHVRNDRDNKLWTWPFELVSAAPEGSPPPPDRTVTLKPLFGESKYQLRELDDDEAAAEMRMAQAEARAETRAERRS